jgi:hypothetical protein
MLIAGESDRRINTAQPHTRNIPQSCEKRLSRESAAQSLTSLRAAGPALAALAPTSFDFKGHRTMTREWKLRHVLLTWRKSACLRLAMPLT